MNRTYDEEQLHRCLRQIEPSIAQWFIEDVLKTCDRLRNQVASLNRKLQRTRTENKRLRMENQKLLEYVKWLE